MIRNSFFCVLFAITISCDSKIDQRAEYNSSIFEEILFLNVDIVKDTIKPEEKFTGKIFFTKDSLFQVAKKNGKDSYVSYSLRLPKELDLLAFDEKQDTAYFKFSISSGSLDTNSKIFLPIEWEAIGKIDFQEDNTFDTTFIYSSSVIVEVN